LSDSSAFFRIAVGTFSGYFLTFFAQYFDCFIEIAFGFDEGSFTVHHTCAGSLAEFIYVCGGNICHFY